MKRNAGVSFTRAKTVINQINLNLDGQLVVSLQQHIGTPISPIMMECMVRASVLIPLQIMKVLHCNWLNIIVCMLCRPLVIIKDKGK